MVQQHRRLSAPLVVALVLSWCLLLCGMPSVEAAEGQSGHSDAVHSEHAPAAESGAPCHGDMASETAEAEAHSHVGDDCESCDSQPEPASGAGVSAMILSTLDWMLSLNAPPVRTDVVAALPSDSPPPPARLHLIKAVFLI